jgi:hypothetical protein
LEAGGLTARHLAFTLHQVEACSAVPYEIAFRLSLEAL